MTGEGLVTAAVQAYQQGGMPALQEVTGPDPVEAPVFWEAVRRIAATRRADRRRAWEDFDIEEAREETRAIYKGGNR